MKKHFLLIPFLLFALFAFKMSDPTAKILTSPEIIWCGFDFSEVRCIGSEGFTDPEKIKNTYFKALNDLVLNESFKYDIKRFYHKSKQISDLSIVRERNKLPKIDEFIINEPYSFKKGQLEKIIKNYNFEDTNGLGLVYIIESLNKTYKIATVDVVFFDIASKNIVWTKQYKKEPRGFGFRNYWAKAFYETMYSSGRDFKRAIKKL